MNGVQSAGTETKPRMTRIDRKMTILGSAIYVAEYFGRYDLAAAKVAMLDAFVGDVKAMLGLALTLMAISYGVGQIVMGVVGDHVPPRFVVFAGLVGAGIANLAVGFATNLVVICVAWFFNGVCKSMIWPSLLRQMTCDMSEHGFQKGIVWVSIASNLGTILVYLAVVPLSLLLFSWRLAFWFCGLSEIAVGAAWVLSVRTIPSLKTLNSAIRDGSEKPTAASDETAPSPETETAAEKKPSRLRILLLAAIPLLYLVVVCHGLLRDGVTSWMPELLKDTYDLGNIASIMSSAILPVFSTVCVILAGMLYMKLKNEITTSAIFWAIVLVSLGCLVFTIGKTPLLTVILLALAMSGIQGVNHILTTRVPHHFAYAGMVSTVAGLMNSATYIGAAISGYGIAVFSDAHGWRATIIAWLIVAAVGTGALLLCFSRWNKFSKNH